MKGSFYFVCSILFIATIYSLIQKSSYPFLVSNEVNSSSILKNDSSNLYLSKETYWLKEDSVWFINTITNYKYDGKGNNIKQTSEFFNPQYRIPTKIIDRNYDSKNRLIDEILLHDDYGRLDSIQRQTYFYDSLLTMKINYELLGNNLEQSWRTKYSYDSSGNLLVETEQQYLSSDWVNEYQYIYSYNYFGYKINTKFYQFYNELWNFVQQDSFFYDSQNRIKKDIIYDEQGKKYSTYETLFTQLSKEVIWYVSSENNDSLVKIADWVYNYNIDSTLKELLAYENRHDLNDLSRKWEYIYAPLSQLTDVIKKNIITSFGLSQNYPNPFNPTTRISFQMPKFGFVSLKIYDLLGKEVATLIHEEKPAGTYEVEFNGNNIASGITFINFNQKIIM